jgi:hypothetical protein
MIQRLELYAFPYLKIKPLYHITKIAEPDGFRDRPFWGFLLVLEYSRSLRTI